MKSLSTKSQSAALRLRSPEFIGVKSSLFGSSQLYSTKRLKKEEINAYEIPVPAPPSDDDVLISRPISEILKELNKKVPDSLIRARTEPNGFSIKYIPWFVYLLSIIN